MNAIHRAIAVATGLFGTMLVTAPMAFAGRQPVLDGAPGQLPTGPAAHPAPVVITHHGSPLWTFALVAVVAIAVTLAMVVLLVRSRPTLRRRLVHA